MAYLSMKLEGADAAIAALRNRTNRASGVVRRGLEVATTPVLQTARRTVSVDSRQLQKALGRRVRTYRASGVTAVVIGPRTGFKAQVTDRYGRRVLRNPTRYAHLVEKGHRIAVGGSLARSGRAAPKRQGHAAGMVAPRPFLLPSLERNRSVIANIFRRHLEDFLIKGNG